MDLAQKGNKIQGNIKSVCDKSGSSRRPGLVFRQPANTAGPVMRKEQKEKRSYG
jgi:hypothetical protein